MFPITHIWFAEKVIGYRDSSIILGAIFPDIVIAGSLGYKQTHYCGYELYNYLSSSCSSFAKAMITHTVYPRGLDFYGDECYRENKGYCFQKGQLIVDKVIEVCNIPEEMGLWKAHNFIEMAVELDIADRNQWLYKELRTAFEDSSSIKNAAEPIEKYYNLKRNDIIEAYKVFSQYIEMESYDSNTLALKYDLQMKSKHGIGIKVEKASELIQSCRTIINADIEEFFEYSEESVCNMLKGGDKYE
jgi:hypothetical protein